MLFATTSKGVVKALKRREPQKHKEELFSSFVLFVLFVLFVVQGFYAF